jgi:hypothetical protein
MLMNSAGIFKQSMGAGNREYRNRQATEAGGIDSLESIPGLLKSLKFRPRRGKRAGGGEAKRFNAGGKTMYSTSNGHL